MRKETLYHLALLFAFIPFFSACNDDEDELMPGNQNTNANTSVMNAETEPGRGTNLLNVAQRLEIPRLKGGENNLFICHTLPGGTVNYCMEYDCQKRASYWTAYQWYNGLSSNETSWDRSKWDPVKDRSGNIIRWGDQYNGYGGGNGKGDNGDNDPFQPDPLIPVQYQTTLSDHARNGYDRGHMLGSADRLNSKDANGQTFYLSNIHPQLNKFNAQGIWFELEKRLRSTYDTSSFRDTLYVVKGGTIADGQYSYIHGSSGHNLVVPKYFYMALLCKTKGNGGYKAIAFWMEHKANTDNKYSNYAISINELERRTGIDFFCNLPDDIEEAIEEDTESNWKL